MINLRPTYGQMKALGCLMINHRVLLDDDITLSDMQELHDLGLCHVRTSGQWIIPGWFITSKLLREWEPYQRYIEEAHKCHHMILDLQHRNLEKPVAEQQKDGVYIDGTVSILAFMEELIMGCGRGIASHHWAHWTREVFYAT